MQTLTIGIDPDITKSGVAIKDTKLKTLDLYDLGFFDLISLLIRKKDSIKVVVVEASWLIKKSSWHSSQGQNTASKIGRDVGLNHGTGLNLVNMIQGLGIAVKLQLPLKKSWGKDGKQKISHIEIQKIVEFRKHTVNVKRTTQEMRDATLLIL